MSEDANRPVVRIAAAVLRDGEGRFLLVRKRGTTAFMQAGGKIEPGETPLAALGRELEEELGLVLDPAEARHLGCFRAEAANEPGHVVEAELFHARITAAVQPAAEIAEIVWLNPADPVRPPLAPLTEQHVLTIAGLD
jgi:8-oxo-dGTP pyrophosphatase MutT (NUDIX family)